MRNLHILGVIFITLMLCTSPSRADGDAFVIAIHPYLPLAEIQKRFGPLAEYLTRELQRPVQIRVGGNYEEHTNAIGQDQVDMAFLGPASYVDMLQRYGEKPVLARFVVDDQSLLYGVIATRKDSPYRSLSDLKNSRFAYGDRLSTMSHIVPRYMLLESGISNGLPAAHAFVGSHKNVAFGVLSGDFDAGAMKKEVFDEFESKGLRALAVTPGVPDHLFVVRSTMSSAEVAHLRMLLRRLNSVPEGETILQSMHKGLTALVSANSSDYEQLGTMVRKVKAAEQK